MPVHRTPSVPTDLDVDLAQDLAGLAAREPHRMYARERGRSVTVGDLDAEVDRVVSVLAEAGVGPGTRVAVSLPNSALHIAVVFALMRHRALWVPLNTKLKGAPLAHLLDDSGATHLIAERDGSIAQAVDAQLRAEHGCGLDVLASLSKDAGVVLSRGREVGDVPDPIPDTALLMYTSGTTGPPKGVRVTQAMLRAAALGAVEVTDVAVGDVLYLWEPIFHIGGAQVLLIPLYTRASLAITERFSASRFWTEVHQFDVTHIHYLGGILQILLQCPETDLERDNRVRVAWGAGATPAVREACAKRFGFALHETYGMTETSSIVTVNRGVADHGVGSPLPWFDVRIAADDDEPGAVGEILVRGHIPGLLTPGYLGRPEADAAARDGDWFRTGDNGYLDETGHLHFVGRASDSIRVRGENVSAWQVEDVVARHPDVDRCAVVGVPSDVGESDILLLITSPRPQMVDARAVVEWASDHLAPFQLPRYVRVIDEMPLTPSQRVAKHELPRGLQNAIDCAPRPI
ncbi:class I adenylate-forming enzyme family protein [Georgenia alba]|uniref:Class I adenylate-forming enzyme family protein n=1 Tax=Georgenia alba TaxID=2233858 RepID=A0ABW2QEY2_9MICO